MTKGRKIQGRSKKRKKIRYSKIEFKITGQQKRKLDRFCRMKKTSAVRVVKKALQDYLARHAGDMPEEVIVSKNQLNIFDLIEDNH